MHAALVLDQQLVDVSCRPADMRVRRTRISLRAAAHAHAAAARSADIAGRQRHVHQRAVGAIVVVAPDEAFLVGEHRAASRPALLGLGDPLGRFLDVGDREAGDLGGIGEARLVGGNHLVEVLGRGRDERLVDPALLGNVGQPRVEQRKVGPPLGEDDEPRDHEFFSPQVPAQVFDQIRISIASPEKILSWSYGEIKKP